MNKLLAIQLQEIRESLKRHNNVRKLVCLDLGISQKTLYTKIKKYNLAPIHSRNRVFDMERMVSLFKEGYSFSELGKVFECNPDLARSRLLDVYTIKDYDNQLQVNKCIKSARKRKGTISTLTS